MSMEDLIKKRNSLLGNSGGNNTTGQSDLLDYRESINKKINTRNDPDAVVDGDYIDQYLSDHYGYWSRYGAGENDAVNKNYRLDERRDSIDDWLDSSLADGLIDQNYYDTVTKALNDADSYVGLYQGQREFGNYINDWNQWYSNSANALDGMDWSTGRIGSTALDEGIAGFAERDAAAREWLDAYKGQLGDEYYNSVMDYLNGFGGMTDELRSAYDQNAEYFGQWGTQEEFDQHQHLSGMDLGDAEANIAELRQAFDDLDEINQYRTAGYGSVPEGERDALRAYHDQRYEEIVRKYGTGSTYDLIDQISQMEEEVRKAERVQEERAQVEQVRGWEQQYGGMTYTELNAAIEQATDPVEKMWLQQKAPTVMTDADYAAELDELDSSIAALGNYINVLKSRNAELGSVDWAVLQQGTEEQNRSYTTLHNEWDMVQKQLRQAEQEYDAMMTRKLQLEKDRKYTGLTDREDFEANSAVTATERTNGVGISIGRNWRLGKGDAVYDYINFLDGSPEDHAERNEGDGRSAYYIYDRMTDDERQRYNYLYNTEGRASADDYLRYLQPVLDRRASTEASELMTQFADTHPLLADAANVPLTLIGGLGYLDLVGQKTIRNITGSYEPINYYSPMMNLAHESRAISQTRVKNITDKYGVIHIDPEKNPVFAKILNGRGMADVYQLGMSAINSKVAAMTGNPVAATLLLSSSAATQGVLDALDRGATDDQALQMGMWNGLFEAIFEFIEVENLLKGDDNWIRAILNQAITEGLGEGFTSIANNIADVIVMADKSEIMKAAAEYRNSGMNKDQALWNAIADAAIAVGWDIVGGAASGAMSVGGIAVTNTINQRIQNNKLPADMKASVKRLEGYGIDRNEAARISSILYERGSDYGKNANAFILGYVPGQDVAQYSVDFKTAYEIGKNEGNKEYIGKLSLTKAQGEVAYRLGIQDRNKAAKVAEERPDVDTDYVVSKDGQTVDIQSGEEVEVTGFKSVGKNAELETKNGSIKAENVSFATEDEAVLYEVIGRTIGTANMANNVLQAYKQAAKDGMSASDFAAGLQQAYDLGFKGQVAERQLGTYELAGALPVGVRSAAFNQGKRMGDIRAASRDADIRKQSRQAQGKREGRFHFDRKGRTFSAKQETSLKALEALSKAIGVDIYIYESYEKGGNRYYQDRTGAEKKAPNGYYDEKGIHIDLNAGNFGQGTMMFTVAHELTHFIREWSPVKFRKLANLLIERYAEQGTSVRDLIDNQILKAKNNGRTIDRDTAFEEVVADSMEAVLVKGDMAKVIAELKQTDKTLGQKIQEWFKDLAQKLQAVVDSYKGVSPESPEGRLVAQMDDFIEVLQQAYAEALVDAGESYRASEGNKKTTQEGGVKYQARAGGYDFSKPFSQQIDDWLKQDGTFPQIDTLLVGKTPKVLRDIGIPALPITIAQKNLRENLLGQYKGTAEEIADHVISPEDMKKLPEKLANPVAIIVDRRRVRNKWTVSESAIDVLVEMNINGKDTLVPVQVSGNAKQNGDTIDAVSVSSIHGNKDVLQRLWYAVSNDTRENIQVFYANKIKTTAYLRTAGYPITSGPNISDGVNHSITELGSPVKLRVASQIETRQFKNWFGDSKIVNANGSPKVMYHGSQAQFSSFDRKKAKSSGTYGKGFYFTDSTSHAGTYGNLYAVYLSIKNPVQYGKGSVTKDQVRKFLEAVAENEDYSIENYGTYDIDKILNWVMGGLSKADTFRVIQDISVTAIGDMVEAVELFNEVNGTTYDGIVAATETVAFDPTQIKSATDNVGTFDKGNTNIYYSDRDAGAEKVAQELEKQNAKLREDVKELRELLRLQGKVTKQTEFRKSSVDAAVTSLAKEAMAKLDADDRTEMRRMLTDLYKFVASDENLAWEGVAERAGKIADFLQERVNIKPQLSEYQQDVLKYLKGQKIRLSDSQRAEVDKLYGYEHFRKTLFGAGIYISKNGMELDSLWHEASDKSMFPGTFAEDTVEGDQPSELLRIIDAMREADDSDAMQYAYNREFIRQDLIRSIYDSYWRVDNLYTVADKKQKQIEAIRKEHRQRMERIAEDQRNTLDKIRAIRENLLYTVRTDYSKDSYLPVREYANAWKSNRKQALGEFKQIENAFIQLAKDFEKFGREKVNEKAKDQKAFEKAQAEARKQFERELRKEAAKHDKDNKLWTREFERLMKEYDRSGQKIERLEERIEKGKETRAASHQRSVVEKAARDLMQMLSRPTKDAHVPMELQKPLEKFLDSIDFTSAKALAGGEPTIRDVAYTRALQDVKTAIAAQRSAMAGDDGKFTLDVPANFIDMIDEHISVINKATEGLDLTTNRVYEMTSDELKDLAFILNTINKAIMEIDRLHMAGAKARVSELANETVREMGRRKGTKTETGSVAMWAMYTPTSAFERMGTAAVQVLNGLKQGQSKLARTAAAVIEFARDTYTNKEVKQWSKEVHDIKLSSGETVKMTTAQIMSFYCLSHREHAKGHLTGGGIRIGNIGEGRKATIQRDHYRLTQEDIAKINGLLTNRERELKVANELQRYMADVGGRLGNEISMARWDYMEMTEKDYFPIKSDSDIHDAKNPDQERANLWGLLNKSFTKALTEGANDAVVVSSIFDVFANHMSEMAEYNAFALPLVDAMKWYNYRDTTKLPNGQIKTVGVKKALNDTLGTSAGKYFIDLMTDVNSSQKGGRYENFFGKLLSRSKGAAVGWNLRVAMQQPTAILRASMYLDPLSLAKGSVRFGSKKLGDEMLKYSGIAQWKDLGYYDLNISRGITEQIKGDDSILDKINDAGMWLPGKMDRWTWTAIWAATKNKVEKDTKLKGEALLQKTAETFEDIVYHTQVADSVLTRSGLMRSKGQTLKEMTSFMAEPTMSINLLMSAFQDYREGVTTGEKAKRALRIAFCGYVLSSVANAFVTSLADAWRDDDEYEEFWEKYIQALLGEKFIDGNLFAELNPIEKIVFVRDIISLVKGYDGPKNAYIELVESAVKLLGNVKKFMEGKGRLTAYGLIYQSLQVLGSFTGAAPANLTREAISIWNNTFGKWNGMMIHRYASKTETKIKKAYMAGALTKEEAQDALVADGMSADDAYFTVKGWETRNKSKYDDLYDAALAGGDISDAIAELAEHGVSKKSAKSQLRSRIGTWYTDPDSKIKIDRDQAGSMLKQYLDMDDDEVEALLTKWDMKIDTGYSLESLKQEFLDEMVSADDAIDYLIRYGGMDEEDARQKVDDWAFEAENGYSFDDIRQTYLDKDITAEEAMAVLMERGGKTEDEAERSIELWNFETENGWRYEDRAELYKKGKITADQARTVLMELGGKTKSEANKIIEIWDFEIENGWDYEKRSTLYKGGKITADQLVDALIDLGDYTRKEAKYQVEAYDWEKAGLEGASIKRVETWHEYCQGAGVSKETYLKIVKFSANTKNDVDEDGEPIRYSAMKKVMAEINKLPLSPSQKDALAKAMGWSDRNIRKYKPW